MLEISFTLCAIIPKTSALQQSATKSAGADRVQYRAVTLMHRKRKLTPNDPRPCEQCGQDFTPPAVELGTRINRTCSRRCARLLQWSNKALRTKRSDKSLQLWSDDLWRETQIGKIRTGRATPNSREKTVRANRAQWANPVKRLRRLQGMGIRTTEGIDLVQTINSLMPKFMPDFMRDDIRQDIMLAILEGEELTALTVKRFVADYAKRYPQKWGPLSLDAPMGNGLTLMDMIKNPELELEPND